MHNSVTTLPPATRHIITHDAQGKSVIHSAPALQYYGYPGLGGASRSYATSSTPASIEGEVDVKAYLAPTGPQSYTTRDIVSPGSGSHLIVCELGPGQASQMHQTVSVDYVVCTHGRLNMQTGGGEVIELGPGDHVVQRGTMHKWINGSDTEPTRFIAVTVPCEPFKIPGTDKMLQEVHVEGSEVKNWDLSKL
ncbi:hypothetical protein COCCADRAFT_93528 [Bipolaris zeicola 26-R-13]|uniref:Cupin type-2 domain-containing protein n=1 Tax=Cochliobolus carbonum (strain 26-R-13) TaxID=930089 RepID=W6Y3V3_COCC2|nr:uncharacterized protein COCCADRAFT_93528 [Bipolaris zeicola 26-R-13]EUC34362.1 hypothetical protein COCCADRAFT_93528 [Bipolaris zeicola 26-R-13]